MPETRGASRLTEQTEFSVGKHTVDPIEIPVEKFTLSGIEFDRSDDPNITVKIDMWISEDAGKTWQYHGGSVHPQGPLFDWPGKKEGAPEPTTAGLQMGYALRGSDGSKVSREFNRPLLKATVEVTGGKMDTDFRIVTN